MLIGMAWSGRELGKSPSRSGLTRESLTVDQRTKQAFALWTAAQPAVSAFVHALVGNAALRDEVLQETAVAVLESFGTYDPARPFLPWALTIARRAAADARRRGARFPAPLSEAAQDSLAAAFEQAGSADRARLDHLSDCIQALPAQQRELCDLRYRGDLKPARIAELMGLHPNTVAKSLQRLREQLRDCIDTRARAAGDGGTA
jgi:RNA polymerase sigma-70 factor (ECF subfamily)